MTLECILALIVFLISYALIAIRKVPGIRLGRAGFALIGGALMIILGIVAIGDIWNYINFDLLLLLVGMMLLMAGLELVGFFDVVVGKMVGNSPSHVRFLVTLMLLSAFLSAIMLNDAVVLLLTPIVIKCCRMIRADPIPCLVGLFVSSNIGSVATAIGNPQNAYIATQSGISFIDFTLKMLPLTIIVLAVSILMLLLFYRKSIERIVSDGPIDVEKNGRSVDIFRLRLVLGLLVLTVLAFALSDILGLELYQIALVSGIAALVIGISKGTECAVWMIKRVDWQIVLFFIGLFIIMGGVVSSGLLSEIATLFPGFGEGEIPSITGLATFSAVLSNLISNVPAVLLISEMMPSQEVLWLTLAATSTIAGNATLIGAASNIIVAEESEKYDIKLNFWRAVKIGLPISIVSLLISIFYFSMIF